VADLDADFILFHLNEPDTSMHMYGPDSSEALAQYRRSDASYGELVDLLGPLWDETVLITVSDHCQEPTDHPDCVNLRDHAKKAGWPVQIRNDGTGAIVIASEEISQNEFAKIHTEIARIDGVEGGVWADPNVYLVWTEPHRMFGRGEPLAKGNHGSPRCTQQVAIVSGGHPAAEILGASIQADRPGTLTWAPKIKELLRTGFNE
jgi:hypothetical protein